MSKAIKRISLFLLLVFVAVCLGITASRTYNGSVYSMGSWKDNYDNNWYGNLTGGDTSESPYIIAGAAQFAAFAKKVNEGTDFAGKYLQLTEDIDLSANYWVPAGIDSKSFKGTFDGNYRTISDIRIDPDAVNNYAYGTFGVIDGGKVENLNVSNINIEIINKSSQKGLGGIAGEIINNGAINNCSIFSSRLSAKNNAGGIAGIANDSSVLNCKVYSCYINAQINAGGIIGAAKTVEIENCLSANNIILAESYTIIAGIDSTAAGLIGNSLNTHIKTSQSSGNVIMSQVYAAGLVGIAYKTEIDDCYNTSSVSGKDGASFAGISSQKGADGIDGFGQTNGADGKEGADGENGLNGGNAGGLVCLFDYQSKIKNSFNAGEISGGRGGDGGNGGNGGVGGNGGMLNSVYKSNGGDGGDGGSGGNGGSGGSAGAIYVFFIDDVVNPVNITENIINTFTSPKVTVEANDGGNGGSFGAGGNKGIGIADGKAGNSGAPGMNGSSGSVITLAVEEKTPVLKFYDDDAETALFADKKIDYNEPFGDLPEALKENSDFVGWNTKEDGSGEYVTEKTRFLSLEVIPLYAQFNTLISITIDADNGESTKTISAYGYVRVVDKLTVPTRTGYAFDGWYKADDNSELTYETFSELEGETVYAKWLREIRINFNVTGGLIVSAEEANELNNFNAFDPNNQNYVIRVSERPVGALPVAESYNNSEYFGGWYVNLSDSSTYVPATTVYNYENLTSGGITLYTRWNSNAYMEYNLMNATGINDCSAPWLGGAATSYDGGNGNTAETAFQIKTPEQLKKLANDVNGGNSYSGKYFILTSNIDLNNQKWTPIGNASTKFAGNFHGNGFYIKNINIFENITSNNTTLSNNYLGFFGWASSATISQVGLESGEIKLKIAETVSSFNRHMYLGSIIGYCDGKTTIDQCYSNVNVTVDANTPNATTGDTEVYVGGLVGRLNEGSNETSTFSDSYNIGKVVSKFNYNTGKVYNFVGGIIGYVFRSNFANVYNTGEIEIETKSNNRTNNTPNSTIAFAGGICGEINSGGNLVNCFNTGKVSSYGKAISGDHRIEVGGVVAHLNDAAGLITINGCKNYADLYLTKVGGSDMTYGGDSIGGIIGLIVGTTGVYGSNNHYKNGTLFKRSAATEASLPSSYSAYQNKGIDVYNNLTRTTTSNCNELTVNGRKLTTTGSNDNYGSGVFEFTKTSYFRGDYFVDPSSVSNTSVGMTAGLEKWDFIRAGNPGIWEFRLDRNDNLPMLRYMCYETVFENGAITPNRKYVYEDVPIGRLIIPERLGYEFMGWWNVPVEFDSALGTIGYNGYAAIDGQNGFILYKGKLPNSLIDQDDSTTVQFAGRNNIQIYAAWMPETLSIKTITLIGSNPETSETKEVKAFKGYQFKQLSTPEKEGYVFLGWYDNSDFNGVQYTSDMVYDGYNIPSELYAKWQAIDYTITFDMNDADIDGTVFIIAEQYDVTYNKSVGMIPAPYVFGYTFKGWNTKNDGTGDTIIANTIYEIPNNVILYAQWERNSYTITFDKNEQTIINAVTGSMAQQSFVFGTSNNLSANGFSVEGYTFAGWALSSTGTVLYPEEASYIMATEGNKTLYAIWQPNVYYVRIDIDGGSVSDAINLIRADKANAYVPLPTPLKAGYIFNGWEVFDESGALKATLTSGTGTIKIGDINFGVPQNLDLKAVWAPLENPYTIVFDLNNGTGSASISGGTLPGDEAKEIEGSFSRYGFDFMGWSLTRDGSVHIASNATHLSLDLTMVGAAIGLEITLYAVWKPWEYTVTFNGNSLSDTIISGTMQPQIYKYDENQYLKGNAFTAPGYKFLGWSTTLGGPVVYTNSQWISISSTCTLYAMWEKIEYTIIYLDKSSFTGTTKIIFGSVDAPLETNETISFSKDFYTFGGWSLESEQLLGGGFTNLTINYEFLIKYKNVIDEDSIFLWAVWEPKTYDLTYYYDDNDNIGTKLTGLRFAEETNFTAPYKEGYDFVGFYIKGTDTRILLEGDTICLSPDYFPGGTDGIPYKLVAAFNPFELMITGQSNNSVEYGDNANVTIRTNLPDAPLTFTISLNPGSDSSLIKDLNIDANGVITFKALGVGTVQFTVTVTSKEGAVDIRDDIEITIGKRTLTVMFDEFIYNGSTQTARYSLQNVMNGDNISHSISIDREFKNAGTYTATIDLDAWDDLYKFDIEEFTLVMKKANLIITGSNASKDYFKENPAFTSQAPAFAQFEEDIINLTGMINSKILYSVFCKKESSAGVYEIYQAMSESDILMFSNYNIIFENGTLTINPAVLVNPSVELKAGETGYVEGGLLYFNIDDITFGVDAVFDWSDFDIKWYWSDSLDGTWHEIQGENTNRLILTKYKLGIDVKGLFFKAQITGKAGGNIAAGEVASSAVNADQKIAAAPKAPVLSQEVITVISVLAAFAIAIITVMIVLGIINRKRIKIMRTHIVDEGVNK